MDSQAHIADINDLLSQLHSTAEGGLDVDFLDAVRLETAKTVESDGPLWWLESSRACFRARRGGGKVSISGDDLLHGDILLLQSGDQVPADGRVLAGQCKLDVSIFTGDGTLEQRESGEEVTGTGIMNARNMLLAGAVIVEGSVELLVTAVGMGTVLSDISRTLTQKLEDNTTPGLRQLAADASTFGCLIRSPSVLQAASSVTAVVFDKTGVLTLPRLAVSLLVHAGSSAADELVQCNVGEAVENSSESAPLKELLQALALTSRGSSSPDAAMHTFSQAISNPVFAHELDHFQEMSGVQIVLPFDSRTKFAVFLCASSGLALLKGAPERVMERCTTLRLGAESTSLTEELRSNFEGQLQNLSSNAMRVLALAQKKGQAATMSADDVQNFELLGLIALEMPCAVGAVETVQRLRTQGIKVAMVTGDQQVTARSVARQVGIVTTEEAIIAGGREITTDAKWEALASADEIVLYRVAPEAKLNLVGALQQQGHIVCAVGDGVNDAPMLAKANFPIATAAGSPITKSAAVCILMEDDLCGIAALLERAKAQCCEIMGDEGAVRASFRAFDTDGNGIIELSELANVLAQLNPELFGASTGNADKLFTAIDCNSDGCISVQEFLNYVFAARGGTSALVEFASLMEKSFKMDPTSKNSLANMNQVQGNLEPLLSMSGVFKVDIDDGYCFLSAEAAEDLEKMMSSKAEDQIVVCETRIDVNKENELGVSGTLMVSAKIVDKALFAEAQSAVDKELDLLFEIEELGVDKMDAGEGEEEDE